MNIMDDKAAFKVYTEGEQRRTHMHWHMASPGDTFEQWQKMSLYEKDRLKKELVIQNAILEKNWLALAAKEVNHYGTPEELIEHKNEWQKWAKEYLRELNNLILSGEMFVPEDSE